MLSFIVLLYHCCALFCQEVHFFADHGSRTFILGLVYSLTKEQLLQYLCWILWYSWRYSTSSGRTWISLSPAWKLFNIQFSDHSFPASWSFTLCMHALVFTHKLKSLFSDFQIFWILLFVFFSSVLYSIPQIPTANASLNPISFSSIQKNDHVLLKCHWALDLNLWLCGNDSMQPNHIWDKITWVKTELW